MGREIFAVICILIISVYNVNTENTSEVEPTSSVVRKMLKETSQDDKLIVISEKSLSEVLAGSAHILPSSSRENDKAGKVASFSTTINATTNRAVVDPAPVESFNSDQNNFEKSDDISNLLQTGLFFFVGLSLAAIIFIMIKINRLRYSRAERRYRVQADRSTQELTPLPIELEDCNSDDEDQTLFELNRQPLRI